MRTKPLVGKKFWFGPRAWLGWGWTPVSWEGWAFTVAALASAFGVIAIGPADRAGSLVLLIVAVMALVCILKGTTPGGPTARREFMEKRELL